MLALGFLLDFLDVLAAVDLEQVALGVFADARRLELAEAHQNPDPWAQHVVALASALELVPDDTEALLTVNTDYEASEVSDAIMEELRDIHDYHAAIAEKTARVISYLGG